MSKPRLLTMVLVLLLAGSGFYKWNSSRSPLPGRLLSIENDTRNIAMAEMAKLNDADRQKTVDAVMAAPPANPQSHRYAIYVLRKFGGRNPAVIPYCVSALSDADKSVREEAATSLMDMGEAALPAVLTIFKTSPSPVQDEAARVIEKSQAKAVPGLVPLLKEPALQSPTVAILKRIGLPAKEAAPDLKKLLSSPDAALRLETAETLDIMGALTKDAAPVLADDLLKAKESFKDASAPRPRLAKLLEKIDPRRRETIDLSFDLKQPNAAIRYRAAFIVSEMNPPSIGALQMLVDALPDADVHVAARAAVGLVRLGLDKAERIKKTAVPRLKAAAKRASAAKIEGFDEIVSPVLASLPK